MTLSPPDPVEGAAQGVDRGGLLEPHLDQRAAGEVDAVLEPALPGDVGEPGRGSRPPRSVRPAAPADEVVLRVDEDLEHFVASSRPRLRWRASAAAGGPCRPGRRSARVKKTAVNRLATMPIISETAKPFTGPVPNWYRIDPGHDDRHVGVDDRRERAAEARVDGRPDGLPEPELLPDALEDEDVGVDRHADRQHDARRCPAASGSPGTTAIAARRMSEVEQEREVRDHAGQPVVDQHEQEDGEGAGGRRDRRPCGSSRPRARGRRSAPRGSGPGAWSAPVRSTMARSLASSNGEAARDLGLPGGDALADHGGRVDVAVEDDGQRLAHVLLGRPRRRGGRRTLSNATETYGSPTSDTRTLASEMRSPVSRVSFLTT